MEKVPDLMSFNAESAGAILGDTILEKLQN